jgi:hypothetical protein
VITQGPIQRTGNTLEGCQSFFRHFSSPFCIFGNRLDREVPFICNKVTQPMLWRYQGVEARVAEDAIRHELWSRTDVFIPDEIAS